MNYSNCPRSPEEAQQRGEAFYFSGRPCVNGHFSLRRVRGGKDGGCQGCKIIADASYSKKNRATKRVHAQKYKEANAERIAAERKERYLREQQRASEMSRKWYSENKRRKAKTMKENRLIKAADHRRRAMERFHHTKRAKPKWCDDEAVAQVYRQAQLASLVFGLPHHVDHIIPLRGKLVCGLHVHNNLQILDVWDNCSKGNSYDP
jgi:hypothetical protein